MIIFIDNPDMVSYIQSHFNRPINIFNLSSLYSGFIDLTDLCTGLSKINNTGMRMPEFVQSVQFDINYASALTNDPNMFCKLSMIVSTVYEGIIPIILVQRDAYRDAIMESIIKFIQQKYGLISWIVEDPDDVLCIKEHPITPYGLLNLNNDIKRFDAIYSERNGTSIE